MRHRFQEELENMLIVGMILIILAVACYFIAPIEALVHVYIGVGFIGAFICVGVLIVRLVDYIMTRWWF